MKDKEYFDRQELSCWQKLLAFNDHTHMFQSLTQGDYAAPWDASGICKGHKVLIEIKQRKVFLTDDFKLSSATFVANDLFLEDYKLAIMHCQSVVDDMIPVFINLLDDGCVVIHNLNRITSYKKYTNLDIESKGYQSNQIRTNRIGLHINDAVIYDKNGKLIQGKKYKKQ